MSCPICGLEIERCETVMITIKDKTPVEVTHVACWWGRRRKLRQLADEETELFGFAISTADRPKNLA